MLKPIVFIDMDGVVADFNGRVLELAGTLGVKGQPGIYEVAGISDERMWEIVNADPDFWPGLNLYPWAFKLVDGVAQMVGRKNTYFFTSPCRDPNSTSGKTRWIYKHFPKYKRQLFIGAHKWQCASHRTILIDDKDTMVTKFHEYGGRALTFPQRWNALHMIPDNVKCENTLGRLSVTLNDIRELAHA